MERSGLIANAPVSQTLPDEPEGEVVREGRVVHVSKKSCRVLTNEIIIDCAIPPEIAAVQKSAIAVGDEVVIGRRSDNSAVIDEILPRRTFLSRPDPHLRGLERLVAANVDLVVHVASIVRPPLRPRLIDRYLLAIQRGGASPLICINKYDLRDTDEARAELAALEPYLQIGVPFIFCSAKDDSGIAQLKSALKGNFSVFVGHSGVGKSSLLNALDPTLALRTNEVSNLSSTGRHTTTASTLYRLGENTLIIDTPGIREFGLWALDAETLRGYFHEFDEFTSSCKFNDCTHTHEPRCAVKDAAASGLISTFRYETYLRLLAEIGG